MGGSAAGFIRQPPLSPRPSNCLNSTSHFSLIISSHRQHASWCAMALLMQTVSKASTDFELNKASHALRELYEAYEVFCAYGTHPTSWRSLAVQLQLYLEATRATGSLDGYRSSKFPQQLKRLDTEQFAYLISDALLALFQLGSVLPRDQDSGLCGLHDGSEAASNNLPFYLSRRYLGQITTNELCSLLLDIRQEIQARTTSTYFSVCCDQSWSPALGCYPSILLHCDIQLPPDDAEALLAYAIRTGTYALNESITGKPRSRTELRSALFKLPRKLMRATTLSPPEQSTCQSPTPGETILRQSRPEDTPEKRRMNTRIGRVRALSLDSFTKKELIPSTKGAFEALWRRRRVVSWPSGLSSRESVDKTLSTQHMHRPTDNNSFQELSLAIPPPLEPLIEDADSTFAFAAQHPCEGSAALCCVSLAPSLSEIAVYNCDVAEQDLILHDEGVDVSFDDPPGSIPSGESRSSTRQSFVTADTHQQSLRRYQTHGEPNRDSFMSYATFGSLNDGAPDLSDYLQLLQRCDLIPEPIMETNWSGRGQHAEFRLEERHLIPLEAEKSLGQTQTAIVESVRCKRVRLVRKIIRCNKRSGIKKEEAVSEVQHLYRAQHSHIVRLVGTYVVGDDLAILTYPCAEWDLQTFMSTAATAPDFFERASALRKFFTCLANVLDFIHSFPIKHMDIKPQNLLVRDIRHSAINDSDPFKIYVTDFGISRSYTSLEACDTETPTSFTRKYAAMEVVLQESRGLAADIFSLGCVYAEMLATLLDVSKVLDTSTQETISTYWDSLRSARTDPQLGLRPYHSSLQSVRGWLFTLPMFEPELIAVHGWISQMLDHEAAKRPTARQIADDPHLPFSCLSCSLRSGPEDFEVAPPITASPEHPP